MAWVIPAVAAGHAWGAPLKSATVIGIHNEVVVDKEGAGTRPAKVTDTLAGQDALHTGKQSKAELEFADKSVARLGSNTIFSFDPGSRDMHLKQGKALICVPPGVNGARIASPSATAAVFGDVVAMQVSEGGATQIVVLSQDEHGPVTVTFNKNGETRTLQAGQMLTIDPAATHMPAPAEISVEVFLQSSGLVKTEGGFKNKLPATAQKEMAQAKQLQTSEMARGDLQTVSVVLAGETSGVSRDSFVVDNYAVQSVTARGFAGTYSASGAKGDHGTLVVRDDGSITGSGVNSHGQTATFTGNITTQGAMNFTGTTSRGATFTASGSASGGTSGNFSGSGSSSGPGAGGTGSVSGTYTIGASSASGSFTTGKGDSGTWSATRTQ